MVIRKATLLGVYTRWCQIGDTGPMDLGELRRARREALKAYIDAHFAGVLNRFAARLGETQSYIKGLVDGKKSFAEMTALRLQNKIFNNGLMPINLLSPALGAASSVNAQAYEMELKLLTAFRHLPLLRRAQVVAEIAIEALNTAKGDRDRPTQPEKGAKEITTIV